MDNGQGCDTRESEFTRVLIGRLQEATERANGLACAVHNVTSGLVGDQPIESPSTNPGEAKCCEARHGGRLGELELTTDALFHGLVSAEKAVRRLEDENI